MFSCAGLESEQQSSNSAMAVTNARPKENLRLQAGGRKSGAVPLPCGGLNRGWLRRYEAAVALVERAERSLLARGAGGRMVRCEWRLRAEPPGRTLLLPPSSITRRAQSFLQLLAAALNSLIFQFIIFSPCWMLKMGWICLWRRESTKVLETTEL